MTSFAGLATSSASLATSFSCLATSSASLVSGFFSPEPSYGIIETGFVIKNTGISSLVNELGLDNNFAEGHDLSKSAKRMYDVVTYESKSW